MPVHGLRAIHWTALASAAVAVLMVLGGCGKSDSADIEETAQQVGDVMASIDEAGGNSSGSIAAVSVGEELGARRAFARVAPSEVRDSWLASIFAPSAYATSCAFSSFSSCSSNVITRTWGGCTIGTATLTGTVTFTWGDGAASCTMSSSGHSVARDPSFTITGRRGGTMTVSKTGTVGQKITRGSSAGAFTFTNDGIRRVIASSGGETLFDFTTSTTSAISVSGASRSGRSISGGALRVTNNASGVYCDFTPSSVTWSSGCNCPTSGSFSASCSDGKSASISLTGCGTADFTLGEDTQSLSFDRCYSI